eukprot:908379-Pelagomonas_calceolata.AAC.3
MQKGNLAYLVMAQEELEVNGVPGIVYWRAQEILDAQFLILALNILFADGQQALQDLYHHKLAGSLKHPHSVGKDVSSQVKRGRRMSAHNTCTPESAYVQWVKATT